MLFSCCGQPDKTVAEAFVGQRWDLHFNRSLDQQGVVEWQALEVILSGVVISDQEDSVTWSLEKKGIFTAKSLYRFILNPGVIDKEMMEMWKTKCPLKQKIFLWMCFRGEIQSASELVLKGWPGSANCVNCGRLETVDHIIFRCPVSAFVWSVIRDSFGKHQAPAGREEFVALFLLGAETNARQVWWFVAARFFWALWLTRNERVFQHKVHSSPFQPIYRAISLLLQWRPLVWQKNLPKVEEAILKIEEKVRILNSGGTPR
jgi:hypothetical protein